MCSGCTHDRHEEFQQAEQAAQQLVHTMCIVQAAAPAASISNNSVNNTAAAGLASSDQQQALLWTCTGSGSAFIYRVPDGSLLRKVSVCVWAFLCAVVLGCRSVVTCVSHAATV